MAFDIGDLGNDSGYVYARLKTGAINTLPNTPNQVMNIMLDAVRSRLIYTKYTEETGGSFTDQFQDNDWGTRYYLNAEPTAPVGNLTGALDITKYVIDAQKCYKDNLTISAGELTIVRYSFFHLLIISPETGTTDVLNYLNHDLQPGDLVFITLADDANDTVTIQSSSVDGGNFKVQNNQDIILHGPGSCAMFVRDGSNAQLAGGKGYLREIGRPNQQALGVANKTLTPAGGTYYILDESTPDAARIDTKRGFVILNGNGNTLSSPWNIFGESVDTAKSQGTTIDIILETPLITDMDSNAVLIVFDTPIPDWYCQQGNVFIRAWYDDSDADPVNWGWKVRVMPTIAAEQKVLDFLPSGASGEEIGVDYVFNPSAYISSSAAFANVEPSLNPYETFGWINFGGLIIIGTLIPQDVNVVITDSSGTGRFIPRSFWQQKVIVYHAGSSSYGEGILAMSPVYPNELQLLALGADIEVGDSVYLDGIRYLADGKI